MSGGDAAVKAGSSVGEDSIDAKEAVPAVELTPRDKQLFVHLAMTRYLTTHQVAQLLFPRNDDSVPRKRLRRLEAGKYLRLVPYRDSDGDPAQAWALAPAGHVAARRLYSAVPQVATHDVKPAFLEHDLRLNSLYVALAVAAAAKTLPFDRRPFRWLPSSAARLPWKEYDRASSIEEARVIRPDAILELRASKRRIFIEAETGSHTLGFRTERDSRGSTKDKIERYARYVSMPVTAGVHDTFYQHAFPDRWAPGLLFVVPGSGRRDAISSFLNDEWRKVNEAVPLCVRALTFDEAGADLCRLCGLMSAALTSSRPATPTPRTTNITITVEQARAIYGFYNGSIGSIHAVRQFAQANPTHGLPIPEYPPEHAVVMQLCAEFGKQLK